MRKPHMGRAIRLTASAILAAALVTVSFAPATTAVAETTTPQEVAADTAATFVSNQPGSLTGAVDTEVFGSTLQHSVNMRITDAAGNTALTATAADPYSRSRSKINWATAAKLDVVWTFTNTGNSPLQLDEGLTLPRALIKTSPATAESGFDTNGLATSQISGDISGIKITYCQINAINCGEWSTVTDLSNLKAMNVLGTLAVGQSATLTIPLVPPAYDSTDDYHGNYGELHYDTDTFYLYDIVINVASNSRVSITLLDPAIDAWGSNAIPFSGTFVPVIESKDANGTAVATIVEELKGLMPDAINGENYWVSNWNWPAEAGDAEPMLLYTGHYSVPTQPIQDVIDTLGYTVMTSRPGIWRDPGSSALGSIAVNEDGSVADLRGNTAPFVYLRQVVAGHDGTIVAATNFDVIGSGVLGVLPRDVVNAG